MEDLIELRRKKSTARVVSSSLVALTARGSEGRMNVLSPLVNKLKIKAGDGLMFALSKKNNCLYVFKEEASDDNFICKENKGCNYFRFCSKDTVSCIFDIFNVSSDKATIYFTIDGDIDERGYLKLVQIL